jgi:hypothetical protein
LYAGKSISVHLIAESAAKQKAIERWGSLAK